MNTPTPYMLGPNFHELNRLEARNERELQAQICNTLRLLRPMKVKGHQKARFGSAGDGGYVHLDDFGGLDIAVSLGINDNVTWDLDMARRGLTVHQFDHTVEDPAPNDSRMVFNKTMIAPEPGDGMETLESIVMRLDKGRERPNMILKMDIENWEWPVLEATSLDAICRFSQITCEMHYFEAIGDLKWRQLFFRGLRKLSKFYAPIHVHANNCAAVSVIANVAFPNVIEVTFANRALYDLEETDEVFPTALDAPCDTTRPDIFLGNFRYEAIDDSREAPVSPMASIATPTVGKDIIPDEWQVRADASNARRELLRSFGPCAIGLLISADHGPMVVDAADSSVSAALLASGTYADHEYEMARSLVTPETNALIVGAHIGAHVVRLAKHCKELIAVEANPHTFEFLERNVRLQGCSNVRLLNIAAGERDGTITFLMNHDNSGGSKRKPALDRIYYTYDQPDVIEVPCKALDNAIPHLDFDLVFMDIEGSEYFALQGMQAILDRTKALSIEFLAHHIREVAAADIDEFSALIVPHFNWMLIPDHKQLVPQHEMASHLKAMFLSNQNHDCLYFFKHLNPTWLAEQGIADPRHTIG